MKPFILGTVSILALGVATGQAAEFGPPPSNFDWSGPYIGGNAGVAILDGSISVFDTIGSASSGMDDTDITFGGQAGWNFQNDMFLFGVEGDFNYLDLEDSVAFTGKSTVSARAEYDWFATLRGRAGVLVNPNFLIYGTAGVAFIESDLRVSSTGFAVASGSDTEVLVGWTAGAGVEYAFSDSWSAKVEYLYADFEDHNLALAGGSGGGAEPELHIIRAGINWHFCTGMGC